MGGIQREFADGRSQRKPNHDVEARGGALAWAEVRSGPGAPRGGRPTLCEGCNSPAVAVVVRRAVRFTNSPDVRSCAASGAFTGRASSYSGRAVDVFGAGSR